ncbi:unnamed protein product [Prorocentrum cordatum]|uniref:Uncharacterized protein n=1 Tax=Prorocentrum cordatum TaxID=2364126 RepID=A0ABN9Y8D8_9DINO|nr:unnamed protein product [Polarella glacialis]|mmetsp:Transcript_107393/g.291087  ORF Transcript_107393/g.291087 Transcript_107393/m.291087 type:complete len:138 (+) Transcript_107393:70-483(+)
MACRLARAALLALVLPSWAAGIQIESAVDESSEDQHQRTQRSQRTQRTHEGTWVYTPTGRVPNPRKTISIADEPLSPFGQSGVKTAAENEKARQALLMLTSVEKKQHMYDSMHSFVQGGPPQNEFGDTFDIPLKSQV